MQEYHHEFADTWMNVPGALERAGELWLVRAGRNRAKPNYTVGPKVIECFGFHFILRGKLQLEYEGKQVLLGKRDMFCLLPGRSYSYRLEPSSEALEMIWLTLDGRQAAELLARLDMNRETPFSRARLNRFSLQQLRSLIELLRAGQPGPLQRQILLLQLFAGLLDTPEPELGPEHPQAQPQPQSRHKEKQPSSWVQTAEAYLRLHYAEPLSIAGLAAAAGVHRSHFSASFSREMGVSPQQYVLRLRMDKAASMLSEAALSVTEIALSVGYLELYSFSRAFKKYFGCAPSRYTFL